MVVFWNRGSEGIHYRISVERVNVLERVHIIGAGGVGMSGLALLLARTGASITASDQSDSPYLKKLAEKGITTWVGSEPSRIPRGAHVYYSTAIKPEDPERRHAEANGMVCQQRHALISHITREYFTIAVAGCHGKTTTSAWIAHLLTEAGYDPTALIGGTVPAWNSNFREGRGMLGGKPLLVMEADESDRSFLAIHCDVALITNIDLDHTDIHASLDSLRADFRRFAQIAMDAGGWLHISKECDAEFSRLLLPEDMQWWDKTGIDPVRHAVFFGEKVFPVGLAGLHNLLNATLVVQLAQHLGIAQNILQSVLSDFTGVNRRMQKLAEFPRYGLTVIDDYAHHPHEVAATLAALSGRFARLLVFWEPHRLSRFEHFHQDFAAVLKPYAENGKVIVLPIFASGDREADYPRAKEYYARFSHAPFATTTGIAELDLLPFTTSEQKVLSAAVFMGAGKSSDYAKEFVERLSATIS